MKSTFFVLIVFMLSRVFSQDISSGKYFCDTDYLHFNGNQVDFSIRSNGCLTTDIKGKGSYKILGDYLIIHTKEPVEKPIVSKIENEISENNHLVFKIINRDEDSMELILMFENYTGEISEKKLKKAYKKFRKKSKKFYVPHRIFVKD